MLVSKAKTRGCSVDCKHEEFQVLADVNRLADVGRFTLDLRVGCIQCGKPFRFLGLPIGLDLNGAAVSPDGIEARLAIHPVGEKVPGLSDDEPAGFRQISSPRKD